MVLVVGGVVLQEEIPADSRSLYAAHPVYRESAAQLHSMPAKLVGPASLLYVQQREMAATVPQDSKCKMCRVFMPSRFLRQRSSVKTHKCTQMEMKEFHVRDYTNAPTIIARSDLSEMNPTGIINLVAI